MKRRPAAALWCAAISLLACLIMPRAAGAVDRSLGADVAKPAMDGPIWTSAAKARLGRDIDALLAAAPTLRGAHVGLLALDTRSGDVVYAHNPDDAFVPASTMKVFTGSAALAILGSAYRFHTEAYVDPATKRLIMRAGGDPLLRSTDIAALALAATSPAAGGVRDPAGIDLDADAFDAEPYPAGWSWDDFPYDYAARLSPLPLDENAFDLHLGPGRTAGDPLALSVDSALPAAAIALRTELCPADGRASKTGLTAAAGTSGDVDVVRSRDRSCVAVVGSLPVGGAPQTIGIALREPTETLYLVVRAVNPLLRGQLMAIPDSTAVARNARPTVGIPVGARLVWSHDGEPLADLLADLWLPSDNFIAEMLLRAVGLKGAGAPGTTEHGADAERGWLESIGVDPATLTIADGSGLSSYDRITPRALVAVLQADWNGPYRDIVLDALPIAGVRGTLAESFVGTLAARRTFAKTGSLNHTRGLAGYLAPLRHGAVTFAWSVDDWLGADADLAALRSRVLSRLIGD